MEIADPVAALDFDTGCTLRLLEFDNNMAEAQAKRIAHEVAVTLFGDGSK